MGASLGSLNKDVGGMVDQFIRPVIIGLTALVDEFNKLDPGAKKMVVTIAAVVLALASIGPILAVLGPTMSLIFSPIMMVVRAVYSLVTGIVMLTYHIASFGVWLVYKAVLLAALGSCGAYSSSSNRS